MPEIKIDITNKVASQIGTAVIVCGNDDYTVRFTFDNEWGAYQEKTARFRFTTDAGKKEYIDVLFSGSTCAVPILSGIDTVSVGVYAGDLQTTTGADIKCQRSILCGQGTKHEAPDPDVYNQILEACSQKLGSNGGTVTGDYYKDGNTFIHEGNLDLLDKTDNVALVKTATGNALTIESANAPFNNLKLFGSTTQDGTPTPDAPKELKSVGDSGSYSVDVYGKNLLDLNSCEPMNNEKVTISGDNIIISKGSYLYGVRWRNIFLEVGQTYTFSVGAISQCGSGYGFRIAYKDGSYGVVSNSLIQTVTITKPVLQLNFYAYFGATTTEDTIISNVQVELGTQATPYKPYNKQSLTLTDTSRSVGEVADEKDFARGVTTQNIGKYTIDGTEEYMMFTADGINQLYGISPSLLPKYTAEKTTVISDRFKGIPVQNRKNNYDTVYVGLKDSTKEDSCMFCFNLPSNITTVAEAKAYVLGTTLYYVLYEPIETPLSETELNAYRQLMTNKGTTTILSEADMTLDYYVNKPNAQAVGNVHAQINRDYLKIQQAIIALGGSTL